MSYYEIVYSNVKGFLSFLNYFQQYTGSLVVGGSLTVTRIFAVLIAAIAIQYVVDGIKSI